MSQKNETTVLVLALLITAALVGGGYWWFTKSSSIGIGGLLKPSPNNSGSKTPGNSSNQPEQSTIESFAQVQNVPSGLFNYGGSTSWAPIRLAIDQPFRRHELSFGCDMFSLLAVPLVLAPGSRCY
ncbi:MAG: hypothetical protein NVS2B14_11690 [Chamaesiphon sp.]